MPAFLDHRDQRMGVALGEVVVGQNPATVLLADVDERPGLRVGLGQFHQDHLADGPLAEHAGQNLHPAQPGRRQQGQRGAWRIVGKHPDEIDAEGLAISDPFI